MWTETFLQLNWFSRVQTTLIDDRTNRYTDHGISAKTIFMEKSEWFSSQHSYKVVLFWKELSRFTKTRCHPWKCNYANYILFATHSHSFLSVLSQRWVFHSAIFDNRYSTGFFHKMWNIPPLPEPKDRKVKELGYPRSSSNPMPGTYFMK